MWANTQRDGRYANKPQFGGSLLRHMRWFLLCIEPKMIMAAMRSRCGHYIFAMWFLSSFSFFLG